VTELRGADRIDFAVAVARQVEPERRVRVVYERNGTRREAALSVRSSRAGWPNLIVSQPPVSSRGCDGPGVSDARNHPSSGYPPYAEYMEKVPATVIQYGGPYAVCTHGGRRAILGRYTGGRQLGARPFAG
jgi:hypothetical protein